MRLKTFRAFTLAEALDAVHGDLGPDAAILHTRTFKRGGFLGLGGREVVEVIASEQRPETTILSAVSGRHPATEDDAPPAPTTSARARAAYAAASIARPTPDTPPDPTNDSTDDQPLATSGSLEVDRGRTRKLAQAMAIRLERQRAAREAAGVTGPDDLVGGPRSEPTKEAPASVEASSSGDGAARFIIGPGGVLLPESSAQSPQPEPSPRVVALDAADLVPAAETGIPVSSAASPSPSAPPRVEATSPRTGTGTGNEVDGRASDPVVTELDAIRRTVGRVLADGGVAIDSGATAIGLDGRDRSGGGEPLAAAYASLVAQELSRDLADRVVASLERTLDDAARRDPGRVRAAMLAEIADLVPTAESLETARPRDGRPRTIAFVGPTGVGKTTTLAKIAATLVLREKVTVALVTADTYRISAVDQLRTYADILGARIEVAGDPAAMREAIARCGDVDAVLVDTPGRSQNDVDRLAELRAVVDAARPHETHLVLSGTASERVLLREAEAFSSLGPDRVVLTKLDEAVAFGMLVSVVRRIGRRISWVTTGQEVPRDIERATGSRLADLVLGGAVRA